MKILALSGSLRAQSTNSSLLLALKSMGDVTIFEGLSLLPYFNPDLDGTGDRVPTAVRDFRHLIESASALVISTPEYAHGIPGVLKNALDWLVSFPPFAGKPVGLIFASASDHGFARDSLIEILETMSAEISSVINLPGARSKIKANGEITDDSVKDELRELLESLER